jgi:hypothetical protein
MTLREQAFFAEVGGDRVQVTAEVRRCVKFLPACSFVDARFDETFDCVFILNAITYVSPEDQAACIANVAGYNASLLVACAFHPDSIESDLRANGYRPVTARIEQIHNHWTERIRTHDLPAPGSPEYSWVIPPFSEVAGFEYRFCSIFRRDDGADDER